MEEAVWHAAAASNGATLEAIRTIRADVCAELETFEEPAAELLRAALAAFGPVCTALANPAAPLPEALRATATAVLRQLLRRDLIDDVGASK